MSEPTGLELPDEFETRVQSVFDQPESKGYAETYLSELLTTWREAEQSSSRTLTLLVLTSLASILIGRHQVSELSVGLVKLTDTRWLILALPIVVAYLYSSLFSLAAESAMSDTTFRNIVRSVWPLVYRADLERPLYPPNMAFLGADKLSMAMERGRARALVDGAGSVKLVVIFVGTLLIEGYSYYLAYSAYGPSNAFLWLSVITSMVLIGTAWVYIAAAYSFG